MLILSDLHFGDKQTTPSDEIFAAAAAERRTDGLVVLAGDLTLAGKSSEYALASDFLSGLRSMGLRILLTPGNHDFGGVIGRRLVASKPRRHFRALIETLHPDWGSAQHVSPDGYDTITRIGAHVFVALRSVHSVGLRHLGNTVQPEQISWAQQHLQAISPQTSLHFVTHRSIWQDDGDKHPAMHGSEALCKTLLAPYEFRTFIHGHNHRHVDQLHHLSAATRPIRRLSVDTTTARSSSHSAALMAIPLSALV